MALTILSHPLMVEVILPFLLIFTLVFAILQKTKILGDGKKQIDALVALSVGLIVVSFGAATGIIISLIPFLAIAAVIILIFLLLYGMTFKPGDFDAPRGVKITIGVLVAIGVVVAVMVATGSWSYVIDTLNTGGGENGLLNVSNLIFVVILVLVVVMAMVGGDKGEKKKDG